MMERTAAVVARLPWLFIVLFLGVAIFFGAQMSKTEIDPTVKGMLPHDMQTRINLERLEDLFGGSDIVMLIATADDVLATPVLEQLEALSKGAERVSELDKVLSPFTLKNIESDNGEMLVDPVIAQIPRSGGEIEALRARLRDNDMAYGNVVSKDFKHAVVIGFLGTQSSDEVVLEKLHALIEKHPGPATLQLSGLPYARVNISRDIRGDLSKFMPIGLLLMLAFLFVAFRQLRGVLLPFAMTLMAILVSMGLIPLLGWKMQMVTIILPVILIAVANDYGIHILARYQEDNTYGNGLDARALVRRGIAGLGWPIVATGVTTVAGLMSLMSHIITGAQQMGVLASVGVVYALAGSLLFIPAVLAVLPKAKPVYGGPEGSGHDVPWLDRGLAATAALVSRRPRRVVVVSVLLAAVVGTGITRIVVDTNPESYYADDHPVVKGSRVANAALGGTAAVSVLAEGDVKSPEVLQQIDALERHLDGIPDVGVTSSIARVVREMNEVMHDDDAAYDSIPASRDLVAQYFLLYSMSGDPDDFDKLVDFPYEHAQVTARVSDSSATAIRKVVREAEQYVGEHPEAPFSFVGGFGALFSEIELTVVHGQVTSLIVSLLLVALLVALLFRSLTAALLGSLPLGLALLLLFGIMGHAGIELNIVTAMLSAIMIGVGIDYTIHFLWRYKDERQLGLEPVEAVRLSLVTSGRGIVYNALSVVVGFAVLMLSAFMPVKYFGALVVLSILTCLVGALVLLPAVVVLWRPRFLEPRAPSPEQ